MRREKDGMQRRTREKRWEGKGGKGNKEGDDGKEIEKSENKMIRV